MQDNMAIQQSQPASLTVWETIHLFRGFTPLGCIRLCGVCWYRTRGEMSDQTLTQKCRKMENERGLNKWNPVRVCVPVCIVSSLWCILCFINKTLDARVYAFISKSCHQHTQSELSTFCSSLALKLLPLYIYVDCSAAWCMLGSLSASEI